jgi:hypothetical protein
MDRYAGSANESRPGATAPAGGARPVQAREGRSAGNLGRVREIVGRGSAPRGRGRLPGGRALRLLPGGRRRGGFDLRRAPRGVARHAAGRTPPTRGGLLRALAPPALQQRRLPGAHEGGVWSVRHVHRKMFLPTYGVFDEARFVEPGADVRAFDTRFGRFGMLVCEEAWHSLPGDDSRARRCRAHRDRERVARAGLRAHERRRARQPRPLEPHRTGDAAEHGVFVVVAQLAGSEGGKLFPGGSIAVAPDGQILARGPLLEEAVTVATLDASALDRARVASPLLSDLEQALPHLQRSLERVAGRGGRDDERRGRGRRGGGRSSRHRPGARRPRRRALARRRAERSGRARARPRARRAHARGVHPRGGHAAPGLRKGRRGRLGRGGLGRVALPRVPGARAGERARLPAPVPHLERGELRARDARARRSRARTRTRSRSPGPSTGTSRSTSPTSPRSGRGTSWRGCAR